jgi:hypothetical protein
VIHAVPPDHHRKHQFRRCHVDARVKRGHDGQEETGPRKSAMNLKKAPFPAPFSIPA